MRRNRKPFSRVIKVQPRQILDDLRMVENLFCLKRENLSFGFRERFRSDNLANHIKCVEQLIQPLFLRRAMELLGIEQERLILIFEFVIDRSNFFVGKVTFSSYQQEMSALVSHPLAKLEVSKAQTHRSSQKTKCGQKVTDADFRFQLPSCEEHVIPPRSPVKQIAKLMCIIAVCHPHENSTNQKVPVTIHFVKLLREMTNRREVGIGLHISGQRPLRAAVLFAPLRLEDSGPFLVSHGRRSAWWLAAFIACCWLGC